MEKNKIKDFNERTFEFSIRVIKLFQTLSKTEINLILGKQLLRSATSIGANYREANESRTKKDFIHNAIICKKEAKETKYWLELISEINPTLKGRMEKILLETDELIKILSKMILNAETKK
ncbi:four helix bundle protein [Candidatus Shapirobacteria bacterium CG10_big_fil_rev_8_21_14_0_10_40_9]|uniref:Four helix bundle protein n=1 Tax=Candidatus Shapirobacteria bacterium CG10_big_fil_rev_8_21_14_0_10_40_9 TaxID=1974888 RepID=A0A2M8L3S5_9BACT|nr:MAG: four helix bundle protein [Candidatus Shapirobacteria bacterium CG10_big_fil_rev_8_21_14_0_10_40_9]